MTEAEQAQTLVNASRKIRRQREEIAAIKIRLKELGRGVADLGSWMEGRSGPGTDEYQNRILDSLPEVAEMVRRIRELENDNRETGKLLADAGMDNGGAG